MSSNMVALGAVLVSAMGAVFGLYQARKADKSATTTKTIELGITNLIDQYQEANHDLREQAQKANERCQALEQQVSILNIRVGELETILDNKEQEIVALRIRLGEIE